MANVNSVNGLSGSITLVGTQNVSVSSGGSTITITGPDLSSLATTAALNAVSGTLSSEIDSDIAAHAANSSAHHTRYTDAEAVTATQNARDALETSLTNEIVSVSGSLQTQLDGKSDVGHTHDHGTLTGLGDDDHTQYSLVNGSRAFTAAVGGVDPINSSDLSTKNYVDTAIMTLRDEMLTVSGALQSQINELRGQIFGQEVSLQLENTEEISSFPANVGIGQNWSISFWYKLDTVDQFPHLMSITGSSNSITVLLADNDPGGSQLKVSLTDDTGSTFFELSQPQSSEIVDVWRFVVLTRDFSLSQNESLKLYVDGVLQSPTIDTAFTSDMNNSIDRRIRLGFPGISGFSLKGKMYNAAIWNTPLLPDEIVEIYNLGDGRFDLNINSGDYVSSTNLLHWWRLGFDSADIGKDYGNHTTLIDVMDDAVGIDSSDIVSDYPGM